MAVNEGSTAVSISWDDNLLAKSTNLRGNRGIAQAEQSQRVKTPCAWDSL